MCFLPFCVSNARSFPLVSAGVGAGVSPAGLRSSGAKPSPENSGSSPSCATAVLAVTYVCRHYCVCQRACVTSGGAFPCHCMLTGLVVVSMIPSNWNRAGDVTPAPHCPSAVKHRLGLAQPPTTHISRGTPSGLERSQRRKLELTVQSTATATPMSLMGDILPAVLTRVDRGQARVTAAVTKRTSQTPIVLPTLRLKRNTQVGFDLQPITTGYRHVARGETAAVTCRGEQRSPRQS